MCILYQMLNASGRRVTARGNISPIVRLSIDCYLIEIDGIDRTKKQSH